MHQMKLTNKQIQDILVEIRKQLKAFKTTKGTMSIDFKLPVHTTDKAKLIIEPQAWEKLIALVDECDKEIAWHGTVTKSRNVYTITDIYVFPQTVTGCTVTSDETEYSLWLAGQPDNVFNTLRFHGHSHVNMGVSPSGTDTNYQEDILRNLKDFYIFAIFNKKGDHWCAIYDVESNIAYDNKDIELITPNTGNTAWAKDAIKNFVKFPEQKAKAKAVKKQERKSITESIIEDTDEDGYSYYSNYGYGYPWGGRYGQE